VANNCPTGQGYELCKNICQQTGHSEPSAINNATKNGYETNGADLYLYGHWWCCQQCWDSMIAGGIKNVFLLENAHIIFNREVRLALMSEIIERVKKGEVVTKEATKWNV
jgi:deoxycytidylate deaminase